LIYCPYIAFCRVLWALWVIVCFCYFMCFCECLPLCLTWLSQLPFFPDQRSPTEWLASELWENQFLLLQPLSQWYFVMVAWAESCDYFFQVLFLESFLFSFGLYICILPFISGP
jgi:hypothetical protein